MLKAAARTFSILPEAHAGTTSLTGAAAGKVAGPLQATVMLLESGDQRVCLLTSDFVEEYCRFSNLRRRRVASCLGIRPDQVLAFASHNHSDVLVCSRPGHGMPRFHECLEESDLTTAGRQLLDGTVQAAARLPSELVPVRAWWAVGHERRITYNRKGRRADGSTYFMREEDRVLLGQDFNGDIDDDAPVIMFRDLSNTPVCCLVQFTGHPVTAYHPEDPVVHGEYPQVACEHLSKAFDGIPVAFLQGCAGDTSSKGFITNRPVDERVSDAVRYGVFLGETYMQAARSLKRSQRQDLGLASARVRLPFRPLPSAMRLRAIIREIETFMESCARGDESALACVGLNLPRAFSPRYRIELVRPTLRWAEWALSFHTEGRLAEVPRCAEAEVAAIRIGDIGIVGMFGEPFLGIGRQIKRQSILPLAVPCGYMNDSALAYIPDAPNNGDWDYPSSFFRNTTSLLPYRNPAGDRLARTGVRLLEAITEV
ncbi:MAG: hypothetical protein HXY20_12515 [Acidobacteria bacterium]|nr:hypothetical protein [Acidobacteriota bacterium]